MTNVRTLADIRNDIEYGRSPTETTPFFGRSESNGDSPRASMPIMFLELLFPYISLKSSLLVITLCQWAIYIATLCVGSEFFLVPSWTTLREFGANIPPLVVKGQLWRLICPAFLHANFVHIFFNTFFQMRMGFTIERKYGILPFLILYITAAVIGNVFSAVVFFCDLKVGASTSGFGMIGVNIAELILAWHAMRHRERVVVNIMIFITMMTLFMFTFSGGSIDQMGHIGGLITGLSLGYFYNYNNENKPRWYKVGLYVVSFCFSSFVICSFVLLFSLKRECFVDFSS